MQYLCTLPYKQAWDKPVYVVAEIGYDRKVFFEPLKEAAGLVASKKMLVE